MTTLTGSSVDDTGVVLIGKDEGDRLHRALAALSDCSATIVYVDSGSRDGSVEYAKSSPAIVESLGPDLPFTAARARNVGLKVLQRHSRNMTFVQFIDGDCELAPGWIATARAFLEEHPRVAFVTGELKERFPEASVYNRLQDIEWRRPAGVVQACGGIFMARVALFDRAGGFDSSLPAGEEPELCERIRRLGYSVYRLPEPMAMHDSALLSFRQWWRRQIRTGHSTLDLALRFRYEPYKRLVRSALLWAVLYPLSVLAGFTLGYWWGGPLAAGATLLCCLLPLGLQVLRIARRTEAQGFPADLARANGVLTLLSKLAQVWGQCSWITERAFSRRTKRTSIGLPEGDGEQKE